MNATLLSLIPFMPLFSFLLLITFGRKLSWSLASLASTVSVGCSAVFSLYLVSQLPESGLHVTLWHWFSFSAGAMAQEVAVDFAFSLDALSGVMLLVVSNVGFLIHVFAAIYMKEDKNFSRFMAYMNLFIVAMLILILADNLVLLYLGWEGVGLCSFLLIGFWYQEPENVLAARKAFIVTRIGDTALAIGLFLLFKELYTLNIQAINEQAGHIWQLGDDGPYWIALFLLGGAVGKSAQLPLHTWLPDAMAGPTPVSALIHAATMVTAGVYLIARMHGVFMLSPEVMNYVAWVGGATLLLAGCAALAQSDIKRVLAYSTMSQIGYMMLALGAGAWSASIFHLMTHAFFKALLFLTAGAVIYALHHQQSLFKMGGLLKRLPFETALFVIGLICLMALPGTSGFFSKEAIIATLWSSPTAGASLWWVAIIGALITSIYSCRLFFLAFLGSSRFTTDVTPMKNAILRSALIVLAILSIVGGLLAPDLSHVFSMGDSSESAVAIEEPSWLHAVAILTPFIGILIAWFYFTSYRNPQHRTLEENDSSIYRFCKTGLGFDTLFDVFLVKPYCFLARLNHKDIFDQFILLSAQYTALCHDALTALQTGKARWYAASLGLAIAIILGVYAL